MIPVTISEMQIVTLEIAQRRLLKRLIDNGFKLKIVFPINQNRYSIITGIKDDQPKNILLVYKRDFFHNFGIELRHLGAVGLGETLNSEDIKTALRMQVEDIYFVYPSGSCYTMPMIEFLIKSIKWQNKELKEVRSISLHELKRLYDLR
jgi:hypothetical protein